MRRCVRAHRFFVICILSLWFAAFAKASVPPQTSSATTQSPTAAQLSTPESEASQQNRTEQYTLSRERYEKAIAYSRAGYTLYFVSSFLGLLVVFLILRLGVAAKLRDIAESVSDKRWLQCLIFVPLLLLIADFCDLPVSMYWHRLSLHYEQSVQGWGSWILDWMKAEAITIGFA